MNESSSSSTYDHTSSSSTNDHTSSSSTSSYPRWNIDADDDAAFRTTHAKSSDAADSSAKSALVSCEWLARALLDFAEQPLVLHADWLDGKAATDYERAHIAGALLFDSDWIEDGCPTWRLLEFETLTRVFGDVGIDGR